MHEGVRVFNKTIKTLGLCSHFSVNEHSMQNPKFTILKAVINAIEIYINCHVFSVELQSDSMRSSDHTQTRCTLQENSVVTRIKPEFTGAINTDYFLPAADHFFHHFVRTTQKRRSKQDHIPRLDEF